MCDDNCIFLWCWSSHSPRQNALSSATSDTANSLEYCFPWTWGWDGSFSFSYSNIWNRQALFLYFPFICSHLAAFWWLLFRRKSFSAQSSLLLCLDQRHNIIFPLTRTHMEFSLPQTRRWRLILNGRQYGLVAWSEPPHACVRCSDEPLVSLSQVQISVPRTRSSSPTRDSFMWDYGKPNLLTRWTLWWVKEMDVRGRADESQQKR